MTEQEEKELIRQTKEKYHIGVKVKSAYSTNEFIVKSDNFYLEKYGIRLKQDSWDYWIKYNERWAEIISSPQPIELNFSIF